SLDALKESGWLRLNYPEPFVPFRDGFFTPSGKLAFVCDDMAELGLDPVAGYTPPYEAASAASSRYRLALIAAADHYFLNSMFANVPRQVQRAGEAVLWIHPLDARPRGLADGALARIFNDRGEFTAQVQVTERVRRGVVATTKGRWPS